MDKGRTAVLAGALRKDRSLLESLKEQAEPEQQEEIEQRISHIDQLIGDKSYEKCSEHPTYTEGCFICEYVKETEETLEYAEQMNMRFGPRFYTEEQREFMEEVVRNRKPLKAPLFPLKK